MSENLATTSPCPACGKPMAAAMGVCKGCGLALAEPPLPHRAALLDVDTERPVYAPHPAAKPLPAPPPLVRLASGVVSSAGVLRSREPDEDSILVLELCRVLDGIPEWFGFYAVADGMGGQEAGEVASRVALEALAVSVIERLGKPWLARQPVPLEQLESELGLAVQDANARVQQSNLEAGKDMGTTLTACLVLEQRMIGVNVGDSRIYLYRRLQDDLRRVSRDQSLVQQLVEAGEITDDDVYTDPRRNIILSSLGGEATDCGAETFVHPLDVGDKILLCSDGLWEMIRDQDLIKVIDPKVDPQQCAEDLVTLACINGGADNVSAVVVELQARHRL